MNKLTQPPTIQLNGEKRPLSGPQTLINLLQELSIPKEKVVVEVNMEIIPKDQWHTHTLNDGDEVEIG